MFPTVEKEYGVSIFSPQELRALKEFPSSKSRVFAFVNSSELKRLCVSQGVYNCIQCKSDSLGESERSIIVSLLSVVKSFGFEEYYQINKSNFVMSSNRDEIPVLRSYGSVLTELLEAFKEGNGAKASKILRVHLKKLLELSKGLGEFIDVAENRPISINRIQQVVEELNTLGEAYSSLQKKFDENKSIAVNEVKRLQSALGEAERKVVESQREAERKVAELQKALEESESRIESVKEEAQRLNSSTLQENEILIEQVSSLRGQLENVRSESEQALQEAKEQYKDEVAELQESFLVEKERLTNAHALAIDGLKMQHQSEINQLMQERQSEEPQQSNLFTSPTEDKSESSEELAALREQNEKNSRRVMELEAEIAKTVEDNSSMVSNLRNLITKVEVLQTQMATVKVETEQSINARWERTINDRVSKATDEYLMRIKSLETQLQSRGESRGNEELEQLYTNTLREIENKYKIQLNFLESEKERLETENTLLNNQLSSLEVIQATTVTAQSSEQEVKILELQSKLRSTLGEIEKQRSVINEFENSDINQMLQREKAKTQQLQEVITSLRHKIPLTNEKLPVLTDKDVVKCPVLYFKDVCQSSIVVSIINYVLEFVQRQTSFSLKDIGIVVYDNANTLNIIQFKKVKGGVQYYNTGDPLQTNTCVYHNSSVNKEFLTKLEYNSRRLLVVIDRLCGQEDAIVVNDMEEFFLVDTLSDLELLSRRYMMKLSEFKKKCIILSPNENESGYLGAVSLPSSENGSVNFMELSFLGKVLSSMVE